MIIAKNAMKTQANQGAINLLISFCENPTISKSKNKAIISIENQGRITCTYSIPGEKVIKTIAKIAETKILIKQPSFSVQCGDVV